MKNIISCMVCGLLLPLVSLAQQVFLGQGIVAGEVTDSSVILQSRLTASTKKVNGDLKGAKGYGKFELALDADFEQVIGTRWHSALPENDFIIKAYVGNLIPGEKYYYRLKYGIDKENITVSDIGSFQTLFGAEKEGDISIALTTCINYYFYYYGRYNQKKAYKGQDKALGYPALKAIKKLNPTYFIGNGDNVYFDHPNDSQYQRALKKGEQPHPGDFGGKEVKDEAGMRKKYHQQFSLPRFHDLFKNTGTYWTKDDHDYRANDADTIMKFPISHALGIKNFREQLPVTHPEGNQKETYRTHRMSKDVQVWFLEGRDYRSPNKQKPGLKKTMLGAAQITWLKTTLLQSDATFKLIVSPTPIVGPDDGYKNDNLVNDKGFRYEGEALMQWFKDQGLLEKNLYWLTGDRHWQYHAQHPTGLEEFCSGTLDDNNARKGRLAGDSKSSDPKGLIKQFYIQADEASVSGGFLFIHLKRKKKKAVALFDFYDEEGTLLYSIQKKAK
ncbi:alkaline phosphatase D family protein [Ochrovirga pacifica]|uniref:alkaline phosphatase D family protein n=1 Tax=Ochrovirga pacifica TaxID=1042376 RepID=UPI0002559FD9|nr:alkaline phosphatase D family protein [Ochrovirga pacifica]